MEVDLHFLQARYTQPMVTLCVWRSISLSPMRCIKCTLQRSALWSALVHFIPVKGLIAFYLGRMYKSHMSFIFPQNSFKTANTVLPNMEMFAVFDIVKNIMNDAVQDFSPGENIFCCFFLHCMVLCLNFISTRTRCIQTESGHVAFSRSQ